jgi:hypothetical protein
LGKGEVIAAIFIGTGRITQAGKGPLKMVTRLAMGIVGLVCVVRKEKTTARGKVS